MQVDLYELLFIKENAPKGIWSIVAERLNDKGFKDVTRFTVANEVTGIDSDYRPEIINEVREVFAMLKPGLTYKKAS